MSTPATLDLGGAVILPPADADATARYAAAELARFLYLLSGSVSQVTRDAGDAGAIIALGTDSTLPAQAFSLKGQPPRRLCINGGDSAGILYGVYALLERLGMGFYNGGETYPDRTGALTVAADLEVAAAPAFGVRGNMLHYNFLCGPTDWGLADYKFYFDQLARQRMNLLLMHWYDGEPGAAYEVDGVYRAGGTTPSSLTRPWGALAAQRTSEFAFGAGDFFDQEYFTSPAAEDFPDLITEFRRSEAIFREATAYAAARGIRVAAGFEAPGGQIDPTGAETIARFQTRVRQFLARNPELTYFALWQHESGGCTGSAPPPPDTAAGRLLAAHRDNFAYLGNERRIWEAIRYGQFARLAQAVLDDVAPHLRLVVVGWGGDRWMRFADYCLAYDRLLPERVIFTCHENIDASLGPNVSTPWGQLPPQRERWAMPWVEGDINDCWARQANVEALGLLAPDALQKGCQGFLNLQWRTRDVEEENAFSAQFAWDPQLTPERFYQRLGLQAFGPREGPRLAEIIGQLQRQWHRWTGVRGTNECGKMVWTGWDPHFPFELAGAAAVMLADLAAELAGALAEVPDPAEDPNAGAFHLRPSEATGRGSDAERPGVQAAAAIAQRLRSLAAENDSTRLRTTLQEIHEEVYALRYDLVTSGMTGTGYRAMDGFLFALHHTINGPSVSEKMAALRALLGELAEIRSRLASAAPGRLERLDYLVASIAFVVNFDQAAILLAPGEVVEQALSAATDATEPAAVATAAWTQLVGAGMRQAIAAWTDKLTTRCDWGVLTTLCVKPLPLYLQTLAKLAAYLPAAPVLTFQVRGQADEVWLTAPPTGAAGYHVYRRPPGGEWVRATREPLLPTLPVFIDRPPHGIYDYAFTALAEDGWESPKSHAERACCGDQPPPRIVAAKPFGQAAAGQAFAVRVIVRSDLELANIQLHWRRPPADPATVTLLHCFRHAYAGAIPADQVEPGLYEYYVSATDCAGKTGYWPHAPQDGPGWSLIVV